MHFSALTCLVLSIVLGSVNVVAEEKRCDGNNCAENLERRSYYVDDGYSSVGYVQSVYVPYSSAVYYSSQYVAPASSYYPYSSNYPYSSYVASSYSPQPSEGPSRPQPSRPHSGGNHRRPHGGSNGGHNAAKSSSAPNPGAKSNAASSISSKSGGAFLALGVLTGVVAYVL